jgi:hypothetical protein
VADVEVGDARSAMAKAVEAESDFPFSMSYCASTCKSCRVSCVCRWSCRVVCQPWLAGRWVDIVHPWRPSSSLLVPLAPACRLCRVCRVWSEAGAIHTA